MGRILDTLDGGSSLSICEHEDTTAAVQDMLSVRMQLKGKSSSRKVRTYLTIVSTGIRWTRQKSVISPIEKKLDSISYTG